MEFGFYLVVILIIAGIIANVFRNFLPEIQYSNGRFLKEPEYNYTWELLVFAAHIIKVDGGVSKKEISYVNKFLFREFGKRKQKKYVQIITGYINNSYNIDRALNNMNAKCDMSEKLQLLHLLIKICVVDGYLANLELKALSEITRKLNLTYHQLNSILAMYNYISEKTENKQRQYKKSKTITRESKLTQALKILELDKSATDAEIKKARKALVKLYHPDKGLNLSKLQQKLFKEKFLNVTDAYEFLKINRGFK